MTPSTPKLIHSNTTQNHSLVHVPNKRGRESQLEPSPELNQETTIKTVKL